MKWRSAVGLILGAAVLAATLIYAGAGAVARTLEGLRLTGLLIIVLAHLPIEALMGSAWRLAAGAAPGLRCEGTCGRGWCGMPPRRPCPSRSSAASCSVCARCISADTAALRAMLSMTVDLVVELAAKIPYVVAGLLALLSLAPGSGLMRPLGIGLGLTAAAVAVPGPRAGAASATAFQRAIRKLSQRWPVSPSLRGEHTEGDINTVLDDILSRRSRLGTGFALHLLCWFLGAAELWLIFDLLGKPVSPARALVIDSVVSGLRTFVFMVPAAAGVQEASYVLACAAVGIAPAAAVAASLARRARDLTLGAATLGIAAATDRAVIRGRRETSCRS